MELIVITKEDLRQIIREEFASILEELPKPVTKRLTVEEATAYLNLPVPSFRTHQRKIGGTKMGKRWMFTQVELDRFVEKNRRKVTQTNGIKNF